MMRTHPRLRTQSCQSYVPESDGADCEHHPGIQAAGRNRTARTPQGPVNASADPPVSGWDWQRSGSPPGPKAPRVQTHQTSESPPCTGRRIRRPHRPHLLQQATLDPSLRFEEVYPPQTTYSLASTQKFFSSIQLNFSSKECDPTSVYTLLYMICICLLRAIARP